jgi:hypothetical protein
LKKVEKKDEEDEGGRQHRLIVEYDGCSSPALGAIHEDNYNQMVANDRRMGKIFPKPPRPTYKRGKNYSVELDSHQSVKSTTDQRQK